MGRRLIFGLVIGVVVLIAFVAWTKLERRHPTAELVHPIAALGRNSTIDVHLADVGTGLAWSRVEVESGGTTTVLANDTYPATSWRGSDVFETTITQAARAGREQVREGPATLRVFAGDYSWLRWIRSEHPLLETPFTIDLTPPTVEVLSQQHYLKLGGLDFMLYKTSPDAVTSGVAVGNYFFPGTAGLFDDAAIHAAFFAVPQDLDTKATAKAVAEDAAGNRREVTFHTVVKPRVFADKTLEIDDDVPRAQGAGDPARPAASRRSRISCRATSTSTAPCARRARSRIKEVTRTSAPTPHWDGAFLRQPNSAPLAGFGDRRSYRHNGTIIDTQTHLGFDLASLRQAPVVAASTGTVVFAENLGIYGDAVIIDHGLGIFSLYGHLSAITVSKGQEVQRGDVVGRTGETGLAGGDHLHFSIMLYGVHVDPVEWWDGKWIRDHVTAKLEQYPRATVTRAHR